MVAAMWFPHAPRLAVCLIVCSALAGCAEWPDLGDRAVPDTHAAPPPRIGPLPALLDTVDADSAALRVETEALQARAAGLRLRAAAIGADE